MISSLQLQSSLFPDHAEVMDGDKFDFIIVGAGTAGCVLANRLTEQINVNVLLIEAGDDPPIESIMPGLFSYISRTRLDRNYTAEDDHRTQRCHRNHISNLTAANVLGGGSSINYMFYVRGNPRDFDTWASITGDSSWSWDSVLPYFLKSERQTDPVILNSPYRKYHGTDGYIGVTRQPSNDTKKVFEALRELGENTLLDINGDQYVGYTQQLFTIAEGVRQSTAYTYLSSAKCRPNLFVLTNTTVTKVVLDDKNNAKGVLILSPDGKTFFIKACREVVISAGALNSPQILMLSGIGPKEHLNEMKIPVRNDLPVGCNYFDHLSVFTSIKMEKSNKPLADPDLHKFPIDTVTGYVAFNKSQKYPDYQVIVFLIPNDSPAGLNICSFNYWYNYDFCQRIFDAGKGRNTLLSLVNLIYPNSRGRVLLRSSNPTDPVKVITGILDDERDLNNLVRNIQDFLRILNTTHFKSVESELVDLVGCECSEFIMGSEEYWRCYVICALSIHYHYAGTCAMNSVVDSQLRVRGIKRLRVVDASIMPTPIGGNINAAVIMTAEKAADMIKKTHNIV